MFGYIGENDTTASCHIAKVVQIHFNVSDRTDIRKPGYGLEILEILAQSFLLTCDTEAHKKRRFIHSIDA